MMVRVTACCVNGGLCLHWASCSGGRGYVYSLMLYRWWIVSTICYNGYGGRCLLVLVAVVCIFILPLLSFHFFNSYFVPGSWLGQHKELAAMQEYLMGIVQNWKEPEVSTCKKNLPLWVLMCCLWIWLPWILQIKIICLHKQKQGYWWGKQKTTQKGNLILYI